MRIDIVKIDNDYMVMELELIEPDLFFYKLNKNDRKRILDEFISAINNII